MVIWRVTSKMVPSELSIDEIRRFMIEKGGKVTNHELVKHFQKFLTHPETRVEARNHFKEYVNTLATISNDNGKKHLVLKRKYRDPDTASIATGSPLNSPAMSTYSMSPSATPVPPFLPPPAYPSPGYSAANISGGSTTQSPSRAPPPYRAPPPPVASPSSRPPPLSPELESEFSRSEESLIDPANDGTDQNPPPVPPRRKSSVKLENKENAMEIVKRTKTGEQTTGETEGTDAVDGETKISVKERMQKFNRLSELPKAPVSSNTRKHKGGEDDDSSSVTSTVSLDAKSREWLVLISKGDYHGLTKLAAENPRLAKMKTALHWAAKHGNEHIVRLIAGTYGAHVNARSGYTPLHIAMQFGHEDIYNLLLQGYGADRDLRDWSGRKPRQYQTNKNTSVSADTFRKIKARKKHSASKLDKDLGFLRMGSLNVRVKRTTEAFSNFLGVGQSSEKIHKTWGSADNVQQPPLANTGGEGDRRSMPPPKFAPIKKRKSKRGGDFALSQSTPNTPPSLPRVHGDGSDSDGAAGFDGNWQSTV